MKQVTELKKCPCCSALPKVTDIHNGYIISCSKKGCKVVEAGTLENAAYMWNEKRFHDINDEPCQREA
jgi:hypothetical protein